MELGSPYALAFTDWLACACAGADQRAARAVRATGDDLIGRVAFAGVAGHVLDYDDTFADGVAHLSAACAPAALVLSAGLELPLRTALDAYAEGFEAMAAVAEASHPALYDAGWHPTAVLAPIGAVTVAVRLLELGEEERRHALALALLRAGGTRGAFGSDGKSIQVGLAAAAGVQAALLAREGARVDRRAIHGPVGFEAVVGATWAAPGAGARADEATGARAIERNWIKLHPSCLGTHSPIDAAAQARVDGYRLDGQPLEVVVHPLARQAAHLDQVENGLEAKFSIPYCVTVTLLQGVPGVREFAVLDEAAAQAAEVVTVEVDEGVPRFGARLQAAGRELARAEAPKGSPERPIGPEELAQKVGDLAGDRLDGVLDDPERPAAEVLHLAGLGA